MIDRLHGKRLVEKSRAGLQIHQRVVHIVAAGHVVGAVAKFDRGVNQVSAAVHAIRFGGRAGVGSRREFARRAVLVTTRSSKQKRTTRVHSMFAGTQ